MVTLTHGDTSSSIAFQRAADHQPRRWRDPNFPQQLHLDIMVDDVSQDEPEVIALGARRLPAPSATSHMFADPAGHPFCLIPRPRWAEPIHQ